MSNLEELIEIRNEAIKTQKEALEMIENAIKENSIAYYNDLNEILTEQVTKNPTTDLAVPFGDNVNISSYPSVEYHEFISWCKKVTNNKSIEKVISKYIRDKHKNDPIIRERPIVLKEDGKIVKCDEDEEVIYIRPSYIKELAEKDHFIFEVQEPNEESGIFYTTYMITANIPKLEFKGSRTKSEELDQFREAANQRYLEQLELERNIIEKHLLENSIDYYTRVLYSNLKSNAENNFNFTDTMITAPASGKILNDIIRNIKLDEDLIMYLKKDDESWILRYSYLVELAKKDDLILEIRGIRGNDVDFNLVKQNLPKLEIPKHKVLTLED